MREIMKAFNFSENELLGEGNIKMWKVVADSYSPNVII